MGSHGHQLPAGFSRRLLTDTHERRYLESHCQQCGAVISALALSPLHERESLHVAQCRARLLKCEPAPAKARAVAAA